MLVAGTPAQVQANVAAAEPLREALIERGVLVVPLPVFGDPQEAAAAWDGLQSSLTPADLRWCPLSISASSPSHASPETGV